MIKNLKYLLLLAIIPSLSFADSWTGPDKTQHALGSALISGGSYIMFSQHMSKKRACAWSFGTALAVGAAKEIYDSQHPNHDASARDFVADAVGAGIIIAPACFRFVVNF